MNIFKISTICKNILRKDLCWIAWSIVNSVRTTVSLGQTKCVVFSSSVVRCDGGDMVRLVHGENSRWNIIQQPVHALLEKKELIINGA